MNYRALGALLVLPALAAAADHVHDSAAAAPNDPPIKITINPEARVSATLAGALPSPTICGRPVEFRVWIVNQGFVTSRLEARLVGEVPEGTQLDFHPEPLKGVPEEQRTLRLTLTAPGPTDITLAFKSQNNAPDLGGRDRVHFLMKCFTES